MIGGDGDGEAMVRAIVVAATRRQVARLPFVVDGRVVGSVAALITTGSPSSRAVSVRCENPPIAGAMSVIVPAPTNISARVGGNSDICDMDGNLA